MQIIKDKAIVDDHWQHVAADAETIPDGDVILPLALWQARRAELVGRNGGIGVQLEPGDHPEQIAEDLHRFSVVACNFPSFRDGRGYSYARLLRERYGFTGEVRAVGDVLRDQLFYMARCGFNAFEMRPDRSIEDALKAFGDFSVTYQNAADTELPNFRR
ncbi:DUF934 domain-containing protein [Govanella unica]|uniref:DUF934 domain-containing protein n=1 Tax=Govanella unica TaxID=2975056 RepID=A0A9X3TW98_9PROT|nr:DUF934 domain-containing protein [Govania unica]MDA5193145.1 DUF934 domain-containing protein [Govania unica]